MEFREDLDIHKTRMNGLSCGEVVCSAVLIEYQRVTDRRTDGRTDVQPIAIRKVPFPHILPTIDHTPLIELLLQTQDYSMVFLF